MDIRQARREFKFQLNEHQAAAVMEDIAAILPSDVNGASGAYPIISEAYDTDERDVYWERYRKMPNRRKLRVRIYGTSNGVIPPTAFLEIKHKRDGVGVKRRMIVPLEEVTSKDFDVGRLVSGLQPGLKLRADKVLAEEILRLVDHRGFKPLLQMRYDRVAYEGPDNVRITFDTSIMCRNLRLDLQPDDKRFEDFVLPTGHKILEVKLLGNAPYWLREMTAKHRLLKSSYSKYSEAVTGFDPTINSLLNRARTLA